MTYDAKHTNPPPCFNNEILTKLYHALNADDGEGCCLDGHRQLRCQEIGASVLVLLTNESVPRMLLTKRSRHLKAHAGEIGFVGGKRDESDANAAQTALREAFEEVGLKTNHAHIIGYLPCQTAKSGVSVRPVVAVVEPSEVRHLVASELEIERIIWEELDQFIWTPPHEIIMCYDDQPPFATPCWTLGAEMVWGLTGRIIASLVKVGFGVKYDWYYRLVK